MFEICLLCYVMLCCNLEIKFASYHSCHKDQLYINGIYTFLKQICALLQDKNTNMDSNHTNKLRYLKIGKLTTYWSKNILLAQDTNKKNNINDILALSTKILQETSVRCIQIGGLKLSKENMEFVKFWFVEPFGEYSHDLVVGQKYHDLKPFGAAFKYVANSGELVLTRWE